MIFVQSLSDTGRLKNRSFPNMNRTYYFLVTTGDAVLLSYRKLVHSIWSSILKVVSSTSLGEFGFFSKLPVFLTEKISFS